MLALAHLLHGRQQQADQNLVGGLRYREVAILIRRGRCFAHFLHSGQQQADQLAVRHRAEVPESRFAGSAATARAVRPGRGITHLLHGGQQHLRLAIAVKVAQQIGLGVKQAAVGIFNLHQPLGEATQLLAKALLWRAGLAALLQHVAAIQPWRVAKVSAGTQDRIAKQVGDIHIAVAVGVAGGSRAIARCGLPGNEIAGIHIPVAIPVTNWYDFILNTVTGQVTHSDFDSAACPLATVIDHPGLGLGAHYALGLATAAGIAAHAEVADLPGCILQHCHIFVFKVVDTLAYAGHPLGLALHMAAQASRRRLAHRPPGQLVG